MQISVITYMENNPPKTHIYIYVELNQFALDWKGGKKPHKNVIHQYTSIQIRE